MLGVVMLENKSNLYFLLNDFNKKYEPLLDKRRYFEHLLIELWEASRVGH